MKTATEGRGYGSRWPGRMFLASWLLAAGPVAGQPAAGGPDPAGRGEPGGWPVAIGDEEAAGPDRRAGRRLLEDFFHDQRAIWTSPSRIQKADLQWIAPVVLGTAAAISLDRHIADELEDLGGRQLSRNISNLGGPTNFATAAVLFGVGRAKGDERLAETGLLSLSAVSSSWTTVQVLKQATNRERPTQDGGRGRFWGGGSSFPSGHSASTWALATVVARRYPEKKWLKAGVYGLAGVVSATRLTGHKHFVSDVMVGGVIGHLIGRYVAGRKR